MTDASMLADRVAASPPPGGFTSDDRIGPVRLRRLIVGGLIVILALIPGGIGALTRDLVVNAYVQVSAFVATTLMIFYGAERLFHFDMGSALRQARGMQIPIASLLGATPGCGGAVVVVAAYSAGNVTFGAVVATLTATMGDAAFLLIATRPEAAMVVLPISFGVGIISGYLADLFIRHDFRDAANTTCELAPLIGKTRARDVLFAAFAIPGLFFGILQAVQINPLQAFGTLAVVVGLGGAATGLFIWATSPLQAMTHAKDSPLTRMAEETSFISIWVIAAYLGYDYVTAFAGIDLEAAFSSVAVLLPLIAIGIGFVPGCGPQVVVTTLYINGLIPFSALLGNAISNDGDALFPAIALNPKAALAATLVTSIPALILAYGFYFFAPGLF